MTRMLPSLYALALAIAPAAYAQTLTQRAAATTAAAGPVITNMAAFEGYQTLSGLSSCKSDPILHARCWLTVS
jgi:hypothetical protein